MADEIALIDKNNDLAKGQVLDLAHGQAFFPTVSVIVGEPRDYADASVIVITAGAKQAAGETRLNLLQRNAIIINGIVEDIIKQRSSAVIIVVSNPVDILTYVALKKSGLERGRVFGSGTVLDSARLRYFLSQHCRLDVHNVHAYVLGEHGDSEVVAWSMAHIAGMRIDDYCQMCRKCSDWKAERKNIERSVRESAYHIIDYKGATYFAIGIVLVRIVGAILRGQRSVLTVSTMLEGEFGLNDVCLSVPCIVSENGVEQIVESKLPPDEFQVLSSSSAVLRKALAELNNANEKR